MGKMRNLGILVGLQPYPGLNANKLFKRLIPMAMLLRYQP